VTRAENAIDIGLPNEDLGFKGFTDPIDGTADEGKGITEKEEIAIGGRVERYAGRWLGAQV
jgi:hypothetical protein